MFSEVISEQSESNGCSKHETQSSDSLYNTKEKQYYLKMWPIVLTRQVLSLSILLQQGRHYKAEEKNSVH